METPERQLFRVAEEEPRGTESAWLTRLMLLLSLAFVGVATALMLIRQFSAE
jgi:hypothetical protein